MRPHMKKVFVIIFVIMMSVVHVYAQFNRGSQTPEQAAAARLAREKIQELTRQDHQRTMDLLGIKELRQGAAGRDTTAPNYANYDESIANPYPHLPDPLRLNNAKKITTAEEWWNLRRPEIVEYFDREIYGRIPEELPSVNWEVAETKQDKNGEVPVITKTLVGHVDNSSYPDITVDIQLTLTVPADADGPVPVMMEFGFVRMPGTPPRPARPGRPGPTGPNLAAAGSCERLGICNHQSRQHSD